MSREGIFRRCPYTNLKGISIPKRMVIKAILFYELELDKNLKQKTT
jgi:hypothetical protein